MWIKICGNTRREDCLHAAECGADAVGFIFAPGKRTVTPELVASIVPRLPSSLEKVGVFTTGDPAVIAATVLQAQLTVIQLHRDYDPTLIHGIKQQLLPHRITVQWIQVQTWNAEEPSSAQATEFASACHKIAAGRLIDRILIDSRVGTASGGTGIPFDWTAAASVLTDVHLPVIVAGGLSPANVAHALQAIHPYGVDVSSGVELSPGVKDYTAVHTFIKNARSAAQP